MKEAGGLFRILLIAQDAHDFGLISGALEELPHRKFSLLHMKDLNAPLADPRPDIILYSLSQTDAHGLEGFSRIHRFAKPTPLIVLSDLRDEDLALQAVKRGAQDYLVKTDIHPKMLERVLLYTIERAKAEQKMLELQTQLFQSQKMESIGRLAGGVAHDFNNLLMVIAGYCEFLIEDLSPNDPRVKNVKEIQDSAQSAMKLTQQLLAFSRQQVVEPMILDLNDLLFKMEPMIRRLIGSNIEVVSLPCARQAAVFIDPGQIEQVIMNLAVNARDAMPHGGALTFETMNVMIEEAMHADLPMGAYILLKVSDTGSGISEKVRRHIFEPFFTTKPAGQGTGLGLATTYGIVRQSGGIIEVESAPKRGTAFRILLPQAAAKSHAKTETFTAAALPRGDETILVVEDNHALLNYLKKILERQGYKVLYAQNGHEAFSIFKKSPAKIDLLLTDVVMPQMSGRELYHEMAKTRPGIKAVLMSGYSAHFEMPENHNTCFMQKPVSHVHLVQKVRQLLDGHATAGHYAA